MARNRSAGGFGASFPGSLAGEIHEKSVGNLQKLVYISPAANFTSPCVQRMRH